MSSKRNANLDFLRGIAILLVIGVHFNFHAQADTAAAVAENIWRRVGYVGVDLFFVLSGFLIGSLLLTELDRHQQVDITRFIVRRGFKIYPVYYIFLGYTMLMATAKATLHGSGLTHSFATEVGRFSTSLVFLQNYISPNPAAHTWSLAVEEHFYLLLPALIALLGAQRVWRYLVPLCLGSIVVCLGLRIFNTWGQEQHQIVALATQLNFGQSHLHFDALLTGVMLASIALKHPIAFLRIGKYPALLIPGGVVLWLLALIPIHYVLFWTTFGFTLRLAGSAMILVGFCQLTSIRAGVMTWIGANSYATYVWHVTVMGIAEHVFLSRFSRIQNGDLRWAITAVATAMSMVIAGWIVTRIVERPSLALRDRWFPSRGRMVVLPRQPNGIPEKAPNTNAVHA